MRLSNPWPDPYTINKRSPYGPRKHPISGRIKMHHGVDVAAPSGTKLTAPADGVIAHKGSGGSGGNVLIIKHANNLFTVYYHLLRPSDLLKGTRVEKGELIGFIGSTGRSTGPHLHWEVRKSRRWGDTQDPVPFLDGAPSVKPSLLKVDGKLRRSTWRAWQAALKEKGNYKGLIDGRPGRLTYRAIQKWCGASIDGRMGRETRMKVQERLGVKADGVWGRITISALQRHLNENKI